MKNMKCDQQKSSFSQQKQSQMQLYETLLSTKYVTNTIFSNRTKCYKHLFEEQTVQEFVTQKSINQELQEKPIFNPIIQTIANRNRSQKSQQISSTGKKQFVQQHYSFNRQNKLNYIQTPYFKKQVSYAFQKFNQNHIHSIQALQKKIEFNEPEIIQKYTNPTLFWNQGSQYYLGLALKMAEEGLMTEVCVLFEISCFIEPYNSKVWTKIIQFLQQNGNIQQACLKAKTAFLFTKKEQFAKSYLQNCEKLRKNPNQICGILSLIDSSKFYEKKIILDLAKLHLKYGQTKRGIIILYDICQKGKFELKVSPLVIFLAKFLENINKRSDGLSLLKKSMMGLIPKLELYLTYLQMMIRHQNGEFNEQLLKQILSYRSCFGENKYKFYLEIAELLYRSNNIKYKIYLKDAYDCAKNHSTQLMNRSYRHIYLSILKWKSIRGQDGTKDEQLLLLNNRYLFIHGFQMQIYEFSQWRFYLHYGLKKQEDIFHEVMNKWPLTGRVVAYWLQICRLKQQPLNMLKIWRDKIESIPKSGELWCQGGRIYSEIHQYQEAYQCFIASIHFTPQYGDAFIEQFKVLLLLNKHKQIYQLSKVKNTSFQTMYVMEPAYGNVWSFIRYSSSGYRLNLSEVEKIAIESIKLSLYQINTKYFQKKGFQSLQINLTAYTPYNQAYLMNTRAQLMNAQDKTIREKLFSAYE